MTFLDPRLQESRPEKPASGYQGTRRYEEKVHLLQRDVRLSFSCQPRACREVEI